MVADLKTFNLPLLKLVGLSTDAHMKDFNSIEHKG
jgi:hypothetical protein